MKMTTKRYIASLEDSDGTTGQTVVIYAETTEDALAKVEAVMPNSMDCTHIREDNRGLIYG